MSYSNAMESKEKPAGRNWWISLDEFLTDFGLSNVPLEQALYVLAQEDEFMVVPVSTDELLCCYYHSSKFCCLLVHMHKLFPCTSQYVPVHKCLNLQILQSKHGISFYQTSHIK